MRAACERGMQVILKQQEKSKDQIVMSVENYDAKSGIASCIGFNSQKTPFKIDVHTDNLEKFNPKRFEALQ